MGKKKESKTGLGRAIQNAGSKPRTRKQRQERHMVEMGMDKGSSLASVIERNDLDEFVATAMMEQRDFAAERGSVTIINDGNGAVQKEEMHPEMYDYVSIPIPKRPDWDSTTTRDELESAEKLSFLDWRRELALMSQASNLAVTPYEKNLEVWRQLWRVVERSDLIVQIVDARNPLLFYCKDLEKVASELDSNKRHLVVVNKADFLSDSMRQYWVQYFSNNNINFVFFSAKEAVALQERQKAECSESEDVSDFDLSSSDDEEEVDDDDFDDMHAAPELDTNVDIDNEVHNEDDIVGDEQAAEEEQLDVSDPKAVLNARQLMRNFLKTFWHCEDVSDHEKSITVGLVGYPNVGKSSIINALMGEKKVGVAAMPGKTRHFQTLILNESITLCDCPGLVFPTFMNSQADLVCNGIIPIDRLRDYQSACNLVARRVHKRQFVNLYGLRFADLDKAATSSEILSEFARVRGLVTGRGLPDEAMASRYVLKDFTYGRLLYCHPPPDTDQDKFFECLKVPDLQITRPDRGPLSQKTSPDPLLLSTISPGATPGQAESTKGLKKAMKMARARLKAHMRSGADANLAKRKASNGGKPHRNVIAVTNY